MTMYKSKTLHWPLAVLLAALPVLACSGCGKTAPAAAEIPPPEVTVMEPAQWQVAEDFEDNGQTAAVDEIEIRARVTGYLVKNHVSDGAEVKKDKVLFTIDPAPYQAALDKAKADVERWMATVESTAADLKRNQRLVKTGAVSVEEFEVSAAKAKLNVAEQKAAEATLRRAELDLGWTEVKSPIDGRLSKSNFSEGDLIPAGAPSEGTALTSIVSTQTMWVYFNVPERTVLTYQEQVRRSGRDARPDHVKDLKAPVFIGLATEEGYRRKGIIDFVDNRVDPQTGTIRLRGLFDNADRALTPGLFVRVRLPMSDPKSTLLVPEVAIGTDQGQKYLLAVNDEDVVERLTVTLGRQVKSPGNEVFRVVTSGLKPGQRIIVNGIQRARTGAKVAPQAVETPVLK